MKTKKVATKIDLKDLVSEARIIKDNPFEYICLHDESKRDLIRELVDVFITENGLVERILVGAKFKLADILSVKGEASLKDKNYSEINIDFRIMRDSNYTINSIYWRIMENLPVFEQESYKGLYSFERFNRFVCAELSEAINKEIESDFYVIINNIGLVVKNTNMYRITFTLENKKKGE